MANCVYAWVCVNVCVYVHVCISICMYAKNDCQNAKCSFFFCPWNKLNRRWTGRWQPLPGKQGSGRMGCGHMCIYFIYIFTNFTKYFSRKGALRTSPLICWGSLKRQSACDCCAGWRPLFRCCWRDFYLRHLLEVIAFDRNCVCVQIRLPAK